MRLYMQVRRDFSANLKILDKSYLFFQQRTLANAAERMHACLRHKPILEVKTLLLL